VLSLKLTKAAARTFPSTIDAAGFTEEAVQKRCTGGESLRPDTDLKATSLAVAAPFVTPMVNNFSPLDENSGELRGETALTRA
jgi:hypothetical protein